MNAIQVIEQHQLSNGDTVRVTKFDRRYNFSRLFQEDQTPHVESGIDLKRAMSLLTEAMRQDIHEN